MKKLVIALLFTAPAWCVAQNLNGQLERMTARALVQSVVAVEVKLAKPIHMSDVMFRRPRGKDVVIRVDYKQARCTGYLSAQNTYVYVPVSCVEDEGYKASHLSLTFADGNKIQRSGKNVEYRGKVALVRI